MLEVRSAHSCCGPPAMRSVPHVRRCPRPRLPGPAAAPRLDAADHAAAAGRLPEPDQPAVVDPRAARAGRGRAAGDRRRGHVGDPPRVGLDRPPGRPVRGRRGGDRRGAPLAHLLADLPGRRPGPPVDHGQGHPERAGLPPAGAPHPPRRAAASARGAGRVRAAEPGAAAAAVRHRGQRHHPGDGHAAHPRRWWRDARRGAAALGADPRRDDLRWRAARPVRAVPDAAPAPATHEDRRPVPPRPAAHAVPGLAPAAGVGVRARPDAGRRRAALARRRAGSSAARGAVPVAGARRGHRRHRGHQPGALRQDRTRGRRGRGHPAAHRRRGRRGGDAERLPDGHLLRLRRPPEVRPGARPAYRPGARRRGRTRADLRVRRRHPPRTRPVRNSVTTTAMAPTTAPTTTPSHLTDADVETLGHEFDRIRDEVLAARGETDARYIGRAVAVQGGVEAGGRTTLLVSLLPPAWLAGTTMLALAKILENMELGHNVLHGQWDWMRDPAIHSTTWEWDFVTPAEAWKRTHNNVHHTWTNIVGRDRDVGYTFLRVSEDQPWRPWHLAQPLSTLVNAALFQWGIALFDLELDAVLHGQKSKRKLVAEVGDLLAKVTRQLAKDYLLFPLLSGPSALPTLAANITANLTRNVWAHVIIFCGHFPEDTDMC